MLPHANGVLAAAVPSLGKAVLAVNGPIFAGLKRYFACLLAIRANSLMHLPRTIAIPTARTSLISHAVSFCLIPLILTPRRAKYTALVSHRHYSV